ncbi:hypothetical protein ACLM5H_21320 [Fredinandcohnia humi]
MFVFAVLFIVTACSRTPVNDTVSFSGEGDVWDARYLFDPEFYNDKHQNWVELTYVGDGPFEFDL